MLINHRVQNVISNIFELTHYHQQKYFDFLLFFVSPIDHQKKLEGWGPDGARMGMDGVI